MWMDLCDYGGAANDDSCSVRDSVEAEKAATYPRVLSSYERTAASLEKRLQSVQRVNQSLSSQLLDLQNSRIHWKKAAESSTREFILRRPTPLGPRTSAQQDFLESGNFDTEHYPIGLGNYFGSGEKLNDRLDGHLDDENLNEILDKQRHGANVWLEQQLAKLEAEHKIKIEALHQQMRDLAEEYENVQLAHEKKRDELCQQSQASLTQPTTTKSRRDHDHMPRLSQLSQDDVINQWPSADDAVASQWPDAHGARLNLASLSLPHDASADDDEDSAHDSASDDDSIDSAQHQELARMVDELTAFEERVDAKARVICGQARKFYEMQQRRNDRERSKSLSPRRSNDHLSLQPYQSKSRDEFSLRECDVEVEVANEPAGPWGVRVSPGDLYDETDVYDATIVHSSGGKPLSKIHHLSSKLKPKK